MDRRTSLNKEDKALLLRLRRGQWTRQELQWLLDRLDASSPTRIMQEIHVRLVVFASPRLEKGEEG